MALEDDELESRIASWLKQTGRPFEVYVYRLIRARHNWLVEPNRPYVDVEKSKVREVDIVASYIGPSDDPDRRQAGKWEVLYVYQTWLVIEAKSPPSPSPWIFFQTEPLSTLGFEDMWPYPVNLRPFLGELGLAAPLGIPSIEAVTANAHYFFEVPHARSFAIAFAKDDLPLHSAVQQLVGATLHHDFFDKPPECTIDEEELAAIITMDVVYPVLAYNGPLFVADMTGANTKIRPVQHVRLVTHYTPLDRPPHRRRDEEVFLRGDYEALLIDVIRGDYVSNYLALIEQEHEAILHDMLSADETELLSMVTAQAAAEKTQHWVEIVREWADTGRRGSLQQAHLRGANLRGVNLEGADLQGANLADAMLMYANLRGVNLQGADLQGANLMFAKLEDANLGDTNLAGAAYNQATRWPEGFTPPAEAVKVEE